MSWMGGRISTQSSGGTNRIMKPDGTEGTLDRESGAGAADPACTLGRLLNILSPILLF